MFLIALKGKQRRERTRHEEQNQYKVDYELHANSDISSVQVSQSESTT